MSQEAQAIQTVLNLSKNTIDAIAALTNIPLNIVEELMGKLNYTENEDDDSYPGNCDGVGAYFSYDGYIDFEIPESIVKRIMDKDIEGVSI